MIEDPQKALYDVLHAIEENHSTGIIRDLLKTAYEEYAEAVQEENEDSEPEVEPFSSLRSEAEA